MARKKPLPPKRKRMARPARLQAARDWIPTYSGKNIVRGYANWFGVNLACSLKELQLLGVPLDPVYVERLRVSLQNRERAQSRTPVSSAPIIAFFVACLAAGGALLAYHRYRSTRNPVSTRTRVS